MEVILKQDILKLGHKNEIVKVRNGYGRNYLVPQGLAVEASESARKIHAENMKQRAHKEAKIKSTAEGVAEKLQSVTLIIGIKVIEANLDYIGSITFDEDLMDAANMIANEKVHVLNLNNGERIETYIIKGQRGSGVVCLNGPAAHRFSVGDIAIVVSFAFMDFEEAKTFKPSIVFPDTRTNKIV